jgi:hypothetical protein
MKNIKIEYEINTKLQTYSLKKKTKTKFQYKRTCEVLNVWEEHISQSVSSYRSGRCIKYKVRIIRASPPLARIVESTLWFQQYFPNLQKGLATKIA